MTPNPSVNSSASVRLRTIGDAPVKVAIRPKTMACLRETKLIFCKIQVEESMVMIGNDVVNGESR